MIEMRTRFLGAAARALIVVLLVGTLSACTRYEDSVTLLRAGRSAPEWRFTWSTIARRGVNLVDSSGNVGGASATFHCRPHPEKSDVWIVDGPALAWRADGAAADALGPPSKEGWTGMIALTSSAEGRALIVELRDASGRPFVGNGHYPDARGNGETWIAYQPR